MFTQSLDTSMTANNVAPVAYAGPDQFCALTGHVGLVATEFSYRKDEEIYGEEEPAE
jgi:CRP/FNR family nitrogen fixation transcriptional regulator